MPKHILRLLVLLAGALLVALLLKGFLTDSSFYRFGHYRAQSVPENAALKPVYQTADYCKDCHEERHKQWSENAHKVVNCETCHGPALGHPTDRKMPIPEDAVKLCTLCHEAMPERPSSQPQINVAKHAKGRQCVICHDPHEP